MNTFTNKSPLRLEVVLHPTSSLHGNGINGAPPQATQAGCVGKPPAGTKPFTAKKLSSQFRNAAIPGVKTSSGGFLGHGFSRKSVSAEPAHVRRVIPPGGKYWQSLVK